MQVQKYVWLLGLVWIVVSCKKENTTTNNNPVAAATYLNMAYGADALQKMDVYLPAGRKMESTKIMLLIHGGAWIGGDKADFGPFIDTLKRRWPGYAIFNINYRLSALGNNVFPTQELDTKAAVEFISGKRSEYLVSDNVTAVGASAGAHLALLQAYKYNHPIKIKAVVDFFGPTDMIDLYENPGFVPQENIAAIVGATPTSDLQVYFQSSPVNYAVNSSACPTIILQGSNDPLVNTVSQSMALRDRLVAAAVPVQYVEYAGKGHGDDWDNNTYFDAFNKIQSFISIHNP